MILDTLCVEHSKRAKRLALRLDVKERVIRLVIPKGVSMRKAEAFARSHTEWIETQIADLPPALPFEHGRVLPILGRDREILITRSSSTKRSTITMDEHNLHVTSNMDCPAGRITRYLKQVAKDTLNEMAHAKAFDIAKPIKAISVRDTKSRWGSCSEDGALSFSWRLIFAPSMAMDYVVAHEVAHLVHMNHSKAFWALCRDLCIDYMEGEYWMRNHGHELMRYGCSSN